jgi:hypothetical protein
MTAPRPAATLHLFNHTAQPARARLCCANHVVWDVWISAMGSVAAPAFAPAQLNLEAGFIDTRKQVEHRSVTALVNSACRIEGRLERRSGADFFALAVQEGGVDNGLLLSNLTAGPLDFIARYPESPYVLAGFVKPGASLLIDYGVLDLMVIQDGMSVQRRLSAPHGGWVVAPAARPAGFAITDCPGESG